MKHSVPLFRLAVACCLLVLSFSAVSCNRRDGTVQFDTSDPYALEPGVDWAVVSVPYAACYGEPGYESAVLTHYRRGAVLQVQGQQTVVLSKEEEKSELWYAFDEGWMPKSSLQIFSNKLRAEKAAKTILSQ
ncbi:MAG: hypothetical protein K6G80_04280 [Treponema sp.]|nr:hypothetical protein [Treponema sp.]